MLSLRTLLPRNLITTTIAMGKSIKPKAASQLVKQSVRRPNRSRHFANLAPRLNATASASSATALEPAVAPEEFEMKFSELKGVLHPVLLDTIIKDLKFDKMMPVQAATLHDLLEGHVDMLAQAKTGTGKTIAFLLPAIQTMLNKLGKRQADVSLLVISPTRELAMQIKAEAESLLTRFPKVRVRVLMGGTNQTAEERNLRNGAEIIVATPGRLKAHLSDPEIAKLFQSLDTLVLDEADRLLDMGFMRDIEAIVKILPPKSDGRQGMLFSATIAPHVKKVAGLILNPGYKFVSTIQEGDTNTHERVPQHLVVVPAFKDTAPAMVGSVKSEVETAGASDFKAVLFAPTGQMVNYYVHILEKTAGFPKVEGIHSRHSQSKRTRTSDWFRQAKSGILVATDVVARGMDFPGVTHVFQVGIPSDKESYVHRLGRTARAGGDGRGIFIISEAEEAFAKYTLKEINFIPTEADLSSAEKVLQDSRTYPEVPGVYRAWLGYYKNHIKTFKWDNATLVQEGNIWVTEGLGAGGIPQIEKSTVGKMGLKNTPGLNIVSNSARHGGGR